MQKLYLLISLLFSISGLSQPKTYDLDWFYTKLTAEQVSNLENILNYQDEIVANYFNNNIDDYLAYFGNGFSNFDSIIFLRSNYLSQAIDAVQNSELSTEFFIFPGAIYVPSFPKIEDPYEHLPQEITLGEMEMFSSDEDIVIHNRSSVNIQGYYLDEYIDNPKYIEALNNVIYHNYSSNLFNALSYIDPDLHELHHAMEAAYDLPITLIAGGFICSGMNHDVKRLSTACYFTTQLLIFNGMYNGSNGYELMGHLYDFDENGIVSLAQLPNDCPYDKQLNRESILSSNLLPPSQMILNPAPKLNPNYTATFQDADALPQAHNEIITSPLDLKKYIASLVSKEFNKNITKYKFNPQYSGKKVYLTLVFNQKGEVIVSYFDRGLSKENDEIVKLLFENALLNGFNVPAFKNGNPVRMQFLMSFVMP